MTISELIRTSKLTMQFHSHLMNGSLRIVRHTVILLDRTLRIPDDTTAINRAVTKKHKERFQDAGELLRAIK